MQIGIRATTSSDRGGAEPATADCSRVAILLIMAAARLGGPRGRRMTFTLRGRHALVATAILAVVTTAVVGGCARNASPEPGPTTTSPTAQPPAGPGFDTGAPTVDLSLAGGSLVELNGATIGAGAVSDGRASVVVTVGDGQPVDALLNAGDTVEIPDWGVLGFVGVDPAGTLALRAQLPPPYTFAVTVDGTAIVDSMLVELRVDSAMINPPGMGPVLVAGSVPSVVPEWGTASLVHCGEDGASLAVRFETDHMPEVIRDAPAA